MSATRQCGGGRRPERAARVGDNGYVETDPTGRYGRFDELLGKGAMKSVYRGFDEERGVEVAWNQASLADVLRSPDAVQRMYSEVQLLSSLRHDGIIGFHASWVDVPGRTFNFITELFSSGTLRSYRLRYPRVSLRAVRSWARQLLAGLAYLHARDPPVIHRDLKCDNIFVNGHQGQVKIGDLGLAAVLGRRGGAAHSVIGTPEFMAPEMYDEEYDERVDVYAFGMCMLEILTVEYPYSECSNPAQIYKKVTAGRLPDAFYRVDDDDARRFIGRCLVPAANRPSAAELLLDPFLIDDHGHRHHHHVAAAGTVVPVPPSLPAAVAAAGAPPPSTCSSSVDDVVSASSSYDEVEHQQPQHPPLRNDMTITGKLNAEEDTIFLKVQIADEASGHARNIYFPFDMASDTAAEVAQEMVKELDITDRDASEIAAMIQQEIGRLLPGRAQQQHEYTYAERDDDDDDENSDERPPPFCCYLSSSPASSHGSHCGVGPYASGGFSGPRGSGWSKDHHHWYDLSDDDDMSSVHSGKYSPLHYASGADEAEPMPSCCTGSGSSKTRFGGGGGGSSAAVQLARQLQRQCNMSPQHQHAGRPRRREDDDGTSRRRRMTRNRSMVDMRSQLLHRTLVDELNRRLFFKYIYSLNIYTRAPAPHFSPSFSSQIISANPIEPKAMDKQGAGGDVEVPAGLGLTAAEYEQLRSTVDAHHRYAVGEGQCSSLLAQRIQAPPAAVWAIVRRFDCPQVYKHFIRSCALRPDPEAGDALRPGRLREVSVISGLPASTSTERLDLLDDAARVFGFSITGGEHRLRNYRSVTTVSELVDPGICTVVLESYVVDVPDGNTEDDTRLFADTVIRLNLQKLKSVAEANAAAAATTNSVPPPQPAE